MKDITQAIYLALAGFGIASLPVVLQAEQPGQQLTLSSFAVDNTAVNVRDARRATVTADDQSFSKDDQEVTRSIRAAIVKRDDFSTYAKNIKIITDKQGGITLRGPVRSEYERNEIQSLVTAMSQDRKVVSILDVAPGDQG